MVDDTPGDLVHDLLGEAVFGTHPLGRPVLGAAEVIRTVSRRSLAAFHRRAYGPENVVLAAAGSVDHGALTALLERALDDRSPAAAAPPARRQAPPAQRARFRFDEKDTEQYHVCLGAPGIARDDPRRFTLSLLDTILGGSASSRLFQEIREKRGMAYSVYSFTSQLSDSGEIGVYLGTREENLVEALEITVAEIVALAAGELRAGELERAKDNLKGRIMLSLESTSSRMSRLGKSLVTGIELIELDRVIAAIDAVGPEDVAELAHALLAPERLSAAGIGPSEERFLEAVGRVNPDLAARAA